MINSRKILFSIIFFVMSVILISCNLFNSDEIPGSVVNVEMSGLPAEGSRVLSPDVETVEIKVFTSTGVAAGTGTLTETATSGVWAGSITVSQNATLTFVGLAKNLSGQVLYLGNGTINYPTVTSVTITTGTTGDTGTVIGMRGPAGGKIFYAADSYTTYGTWRFLEAPSALLGGESASWEPWTNVSSTLIGEDAQGSAMGTGQANSTAIMGQTGHTSSAAKSCDNYSLNEISDWFLPSKDEFTLMYSRYSSAGLNFSTRYYFWSSTEYSATNAVDLYCDATNRSLAARTENQSKSSYANVYPIRRF